MWDNLSFKKKTKLGYNTKNKQKSIKSSLFKKRKSLLFIGKYQPINVGGIKESEKSPIYNL